LFDVTKHKKREERGRERKRERERDRERERERERERQREKKREKKRGRDDNVFAVMIAGSYTELSASAHYAFRAHSVVCHKRGCQRNQFDPAAPRWEQTQPTLILSASPAELKAGDMGMAVLSCPSHLTGLGLAELLLGDRPNKRPCCCC
jgi:hypothetical protein